ncbi:MAG: tolB protein precursor, periplasmic protein involved in the tonb-independent uptake of group A colicins [uncultured Thermomicrobiales bacterium]|uniref:TolB protein, periplasmic protein involved in the tonb-independent uptake of group A colicins n=1 Tax=uncultured Thermomicrobiales bacterium TaxID=1645740 RepID=A0A6J4VN61_9BACT|nr:MAG: tolB protein precursor, periplasmic protein involved in the tonb-independent uptake of group A colicins [uncultured Thermomicrobiales bacterium]
MAERGAGPIATDPAAPGVPVAGGPEATGGTTATLLEPGPDAGVGNVPAGGTDAAEAAEVDRWASFPAAANAPGPANPSPDGSMLAYLAATSASDGGRELRLLPTGGGPERTLTLPFAPLPDADPDGLPYTDEGPQWSPDGARLAVLGPRPDGATGTAVWIVDVASGEARPLVVHPASDRGPRWAPDGETIAFTSRRDGRDTVCLAFAVGEGPAVPLTDGTRDDRDPAWSRDGDQIAFRRRSVEDPRHDDILILVLGTGEERQLTSRPGKVGLGSKPASRRGMRWAPDRSQVAYVTDEKDWDILAVLNADNGSGWTLAGEPGDKAEPRWDPTGKKLLYTRTHGPYVACCVKGTSAASAETVDPGDGFARSPRWLPDGRVVYLFTDGRRPPVFVVQDAKAGAVRTALPTPVPAVPTDPVADGAPSNGTSDAPSDVSPVSGERDGATTDTLPAPIEGLVDPVRHEVETGDGLKLGGLLYRLPEMAGTAAGVVSLGDGPPARQEAGLAPGPQRLAGAGLAVFAPNLRGTRGGGRPVLDGLLETSDTEVEVADLADIAAALGELDGIDGGRLGIVGRGFGGTLALLAAASRPGTYRAVAAIDPIADWDLELDTTDGASRAWLTRQYGLPAARPARYALRSPDTFAALLDGPVLLVGTADAPPSRAAQLDGLAATLAELGVAFERETAPSGEPEAVTYGRVAAFLSRALARTS